jgi:hypothetical protein
MTEYNLKAPVFIVVMVAMVIVSGVSIAQPAIADKDLEQSIEKFDKKSDKARERQSEKKGEQAVEQLCHHSDDVPNICHPDPRL